jgi:WD40 repeat protein
MGQTSCGKGGHTRQTQTAQPCFPSLPTGCTSRVQFSDDGRLLLTVSDTGSRVWDAASGQPVTPPMKIRSASLTSDFKLMAGIDDARAGGDQHSVKTWSVEPAPRLIAEFEVQSPEFVQFGPLGEDLLVVSKAGACVWSLPGDRPLFKEIPLEHRSGGLSTNFLCAEISPLGDIFVTTRMMNDHCARIWSMESGEQVAPPLAHESKVQCISFSRDGMYVVTGSADNTMRVWSALSGEPVTPPLPHDGQVTQLSLSPDARRIATITEGFSDDYLWEIFSDRVERSPLRCSPRANKFGCVVFDPSGNQLALANHHIHESRGGRQNRSLLVVDRLENL